MHDKDIWANAPEDATHLLPKQPRLGWVDCWYKKNSEGCWMIINSYRLMCDPKTEWKLDLDLDNRELIESLLVPRPATFSLEDSVEVRCNGWGDWEIGTLKYQSDEYVIVLHEDGEQIYVPYQSGFEMRTPMSEEDKLRQKVISEMEKVLNIHTDTISDDDIELVCKVLYDEWYSKLDNEGYK